MPAKSNKAMSYMYARMIGQKKTFFMWRSHIAKCNITFPSEVLVSSDKRPYKNLTFHNILARQGSSFCHIASLNFQAFALRDMKMASEILAILLSPNSKWNKVFDLIDWLRKAVAQV